MFGWSERKRRQAALQEISGPLHDLHDRVIGAVNAGREEQVRALVVGPVAAELLDRDNDLYPSEHRLNEISIESTREGRARIVASYVPYDPADGVESVTRFWRCACDDKGTWTVTDIARPPATSNTGDRGASPEFALGAMGGIAGLNSDPEAVLSRERRGKI